MKKLFIGFVLCLLLLGCNPFNSRGDGSDSVIQPLIQEPIIEEPTTTIVIPKGFFVTVTQKGNYLMKAR